MMVPTKNYSSCQAMEEVGTGPITEQQVRAPGLCGNPMDSWSSEKGARDWRRHGGRSMPPASRILSQERREVRVATTLLVSRFRSKTWRRVTCDTLGGR